MEIKDQSSVMVPIALMCNFVLDRGAVKRARRVHEDSVYYVGRPCTLWCNELWESGLTTGSVQTIHRRLDPWTTKADAR